MTQPINESQAGQTKYNKSAVYAALQNKNSIVTTNTNELGYFVNIANPENQTSHLLIDSNFDSIFDKYVKTKQSEDGTRNSFIDNEFDGNFDAYKSHIPLEDGNELIARDNDLDGEIDSYGY